MAQIKKESKTPPSTGIFNKNSNLILLSVIIASCILLYLNSINNGFVNWDDPSTVYQNSDINGLSSAHVKKIFTSSYVGMYQPVTTLVYAVEYAIYRLRPSGYHTTGLLIHLLNIILVFILAWKLTRKKSIAFIVSMLFAIHPMHVESVAWVSERKDLVYTAFFLLSLLSYLYYLKDSFKIKYLLLSFLFAVLSMLSKSSAVVLPLVFFIFDYYCERKQNLKSLLEKLPFFVLSVLFGIISIRSQEIYDLSSGTTDAFSLIERIFMACYAFSFYMVKMFLPFKLSVIHPFPQAGQLPLIMYLSPLFVGLVVWLCFYCRKKRPLVSTGILFYLVNVILILQIIPVGQTITAERYSYVSYIGLFLALGYFYENSAIKLKKQLSFVFVAFFILCIGLGMQRNTVWKNSMTLFTDVIKKYPEVATAWFNRGQIKLDHNDLNGAAADFSEAVKLRPANAKYRLGLSSVLFKTGDYQNALNNYESIDLSSIPDNAGKLNVIYGKGLCKAALNEFPAALKDFDTVLKNDTSNGKAYCDRAIVKAKMKNLEGAMADLNKSISLNPADEKAYFNRASARGSLNDIDGAMDDLKKVISINPSNAEAWITMGMIEYNAKNAKEACESWKTAAKLGASKATLFIDQYCK